MKNNIKNLGFYKSDLPSKLIFLNLDSLPLLPLEERTINLSNLDNIKLIDHILKEPKRVFAIFSKEKKKLISDIACMAKIRSFMETDDGNYVINIVGICRFYIDKISLENNINIVAPIWYEFCDDLELVKQKITNRHDLNNLTYNYFNLFYQKYEMDFNKISEISDNNIISLLTTNLDYNKNNHKSLLKAKNLDEISQIFYNIMETEVAEHESLTKIKH
jgi:Lon protease-like protein